MTDFIIMPTANTYGPSIRLTESDLLCIFYCIESAIDSGDAWTDTGDTGYERPERIKNAIAALHERQTRIAD